MTSFSVESQSSKNEKETHQFAGSAWVVDRSPRDLNGDHSNLARCSLQSNSTIDGLIWVIMKVKYLCFTMIGNVKSICPRPSLGTVRILIAVTFLFCTFRSISAFSSHHPFRNSPLATSIGILRQQSSLNMALRRSKSKGSGGYFRRLRRFAFGDGNKQQENQISSERLREFAITPSYLVKIDQLRGYQRRSSWTTVDDAFTNNVNATDVIPETAKALYKRLVSLDMKRDVRRRAKVYASDWTDALKNKRKVIPAILFLYFSCLSPAVSFGTIASQITNGSMGIVEFLMSAGVSGMAYSLLCGQPMAFIAPTGLTLAFISGLFRFCSLNSLPFFPIYSWVGLWTSFFFILLGLGGSSKLIRYCTRFTDEVFNGLLSVNFIYEATSSLKRYFDNADPENLTMPFVSLGMSLVTFFSTMKVAAFESSKYFNQKVRSVIKDFGPVTIFILMTIVNAQPSIKRFGIPTLAVPAKLQLANARNLLVDLNGISFGAKLLCALPAVLLTSLFFMDQNISVRVVNNPENKLKKGEAYNLDMVALGIITGALSFVGLPWMCGATVQSLNHVRAMTETKFNIETGETEIVAVTETRLVGFLVHAMIFGSLGLLPLIGLVPMPVVSGVFLFLGRKLMSGNSFFQRIRDIIVEESRLPEDHPIRFIGRKKTVIFTLTQVACLIGLWTFKQNPATAIFFPSVIGLLMVVRSYILPKFFTEEELVDLGDPTPT